MSSLQLIKRRIRSVGNTRQITKAMELVAASKLRRAQEATLKARLYANRIAEINQRLRDQMGKISHPYFKVREVKARLYIVFSSDLGLAGAYDGNIFKELAIKLRADEAADIKATAIVLGRKGAHFLSRISGVETVGVYENWPANPTSSDIAPILSTAIKDFESETVDEVVIVSTEFVSMLKQTSHTAQLLPLAVPTSDSTKPKDAADKQAYEPSPEAVLEALVPRLVEATLLQAAYEASASEQSMRMMAMKSASDNAAGLIDDLTLEYNGARQAGITQELAEISAGAEAIND